jgi:hypothetical protein
MNPADEFAVDGPRTGDREEILLRVRDTKLRVCFL